MNKAIFLDRDGTIIKEKNYLSKVEDIEFLDYSFEGLKKLQNEFLLIIVTNQSGIARGYFKEETALLINDTIEKILLKNNIKITHTFMCPHHPDGVIKKYAIQCSCRKPKIGMIERAVEMYNIDLSKSYVIGDKDSDILLAKNCNCKSILIKNKNYVNKESCDYIANNLLEAANYIIK